MIRWLVILGATGDLASGKLSSHSRKKKRFQEIGNDSHAAPEDQETAHER